MTRNQCYLCEITIRYYIDNNIGCKSVFPYIARIIPALNMVRYYSLGLLSILWELLEYTLEYNLGALRLYPGIVQSYGCFIV